MPAPVTVEEFLELLPKSGVMEPERVQLYVKGLQTAGALPAAPSLVGDQMVRDGLLTQFQAQQLLLGKYLGFTIGKYQILELLGSGGMSAVYLCRHRELGNRVAVKVLPKALAKDPTLLKRFYREARVCATLEHPNIVRGFEADNERNQHFLVMEFVEGCSLQEIVKKKGPLPLARAAHYISQAAVGLQYAHEQGLVHRDIKPANLLVNRSGTVKILDMGLSRFYQEDDSILTRDVLGTLEYLAPEQARDSHNVDIRADIYSLGSTFFFLLTGHTPFQGRVDPTAIAQQVVGPPSIRALRREMPAEVAEIIARMMAGDRAERYQTPADVAQALSPWTTTPIPPPTEDEMPRLSPAAGGTAAGLPPPPTPRNRWLLWWALGTGLLLLAAGLGVWLALGLG
jgi:serine/threonine protein kinase